MGIGWDVGFPATNDSEAFINRSGGCEVDQVQIYNKNLSVTECDALAGTNNDPTLLATEPNLTDMWDFEDGTLDAVSGYGSDDFTFASGTTSSIINGGL